MGLDVSHGAWHGAYSAFDRWRREIARLTDVPWLVMDGVYKPPASYITEYLKPGTEYNGGPQSGDPRAVMAGHWIEETAAWLPVQWESLRYDVIHELLNHSDCDGVIDWRVCDGLANRLEGLLPLLPTEPDTGHIGDWREKTQTFIDGLRLAAEHQENLVFG